MRTKKAYSQRLRVTKRGKVLRRHPGQNHFKAKKSRSKQLDHKRGDKFVVVKKTLARFMAV